jgi:phosphate transport system permease protein
VLATQSPDVEAARPLLYGTVLVLLALTFTLNLVAVVLRVRMRSVAST